MAFSPEDLAQIAAAVVELQKTHAVEAVNGVATAVLPPVSPIIPEGFKLIPLADPVDDNGNGLITGYQNSLPANAPIDPNTLATKLGFVIGGLNQLGSVGLQVPQSKQEWISTGLTVAYILLGWIINKRKKSS